MIAPVYRESLLERVVEYGIPRFVIKVGEYNAVFVGTFVGRRYRKCPATIAVPRTTAPVSHRAPGVDRKPRYRPVELTAPPTSNATSLNGGTATLREKTGT